jgi:enoyl-CoA hydratase/carnithine racemase
MSPSQTSGPVLWRVDERGVARLVLNRPEVNNAYDGALIEGLLVALDALTRMATLPGRRRSRLDRPGANVVAR